jgi:hypothetical protein
MEACEDRFGYLRGTRFEVFGQQGVTLDNPLRPVIRCGRSTDGGMLGEIPEKQQTTPSY